MPKPCRRLGLAACLLVVMVPAGRTGAAEVTLKGSLVCNGACLVEPKEADHGLVLFAIDGTDEVRGTLERIMKEFYPDEGLDAEAARKLMDQFSARLKFHLAPDSPAL